MKQTILLLLALQAVFMNQSNAQEEATGISSRKHEIKVGAIKALAGGIVEGTYEYIHSQYFTYGASVLGNFDSKNNDYPEDFSVTPFARFYFTESKEYGAKGFFVEGFAKFLTGRDYSYDSDGFYSENGVYYPGDVTRNRYSVGSAGISLGWKWVNNAGFVFELLVGGGRNIGGNGYAPDASFRGDFNLGYRF